MSINQTALLFYRVGGFVRDSLLGRDPHDIDYVVIGESPESMVSRGFLQVGDFPVFLHPETQDEYALARSEISTGPGYTDFEYVWDNVSLEDDLLRRDLTINAMAMDEQGVVIDPYGGQADLAKGILRHVSEHFAEDPLRVLRVARFAARYGFTVAEETLILMRDIVEQGMLVTLSAERFWLETRKAMLCASPSRYFEVLDECGALAVVFPELHKLKGVPQRADYHAEGDVWIHTRMVIEEAVLLTEGFDEERSLRIRMGALLHDLGKANTPAELLWDTEGGLIGHHHGHDDPDRFEAELKALSARIRMPSEIRDFCFRCAVSHQDIHRIRDMSGRGLVNLFDRLDMSRALRHDHTMVQDIALMCMADNFGRRTLLKDGSMARPTRYRQAQWFSDAMAELFALPTGEWMQAALHRCTPRGEDGQVIAQDREEKMKSLENAKQMVLGQRRGAANQYMKRIKGEVEVSIQP